MAERKRSSLLVKLGAGVVVLGVLGYLFVHSLETTRGEPYQVERIHLSGWGLVLDRADTPDAPLLSLRADITLVANLFRQVFLRTMESMNTPSHSSIPVVLHSEFSRALASHMTTEQLLAAARDAGLESAPHVPQCVVHRRISEPGSTRQVFVAVVQSPSVTAFREQLASRTNGAFDPAALTPLMIVSASEPNFHRWLPLAPTEADCVAPIEIKG